MSKICSVKGCGKKATTRGWCPKHYSRWRKYGNPTSITIIKDGHKKNNLSMYRIYSGMKTRCYNTKDKAYKNYGGRGIKVCARWLGAEGFAHFLKDMGDRPKGKTRSGKRPKYSLDRIDHDGDYCPENCRWATWEEQENNRRYNILLKRGEKELSLSQWSRELEIPLSTIARRKAKGLATKEILAPLDQKRSKNGKKGALVKYLAKETIEGEA